MRICLAIIIIFCSFSLSAFENSNERYRLTIQPDTCIIHKDKKVCNLDFTLDYSSKEISDICVKIIEHEAVISCHAQTNQLVKTIALTIKSDVTISVIEQGTNEPLIQKTLKLFKYLPKRIRRKRSWGLL